MLNRLLPVAMIVSLLVIPSCAPIDSDGDGWSDQQEDEAPTDPQLPTLKTGEQTAQPDIPEGLLEEIQEAKRKNPHWMINYNGYVTMVVYLNSYYGVGQHKITLNVSVFNDSNTTLHTNPMYFTLVDSHGTAHQYDLGTYSYWGNDAFSGISLPPGTNSKGALNFRISREATPITLLYDDGKTPPIVMDWLNNPEVKP